MNLQKTYDLDKAKMELEAKVREIQPWQAEIPATG